MNTAFSQLLNRLGYEFRNPDLLDAALTHRSAASSHNERLEFLGDSVLNFVIASEVFRRRPEDPEGDLSRLRAYLVNRAQLASVAGELALGDCLRLGSGEMKSGGHRRDSILADALEAVFGAIYMDGGFTAVEAVIKGIYRSRLDNLPDNESLKDPKTRLQEALQGAQRPLPHYEVEHVAGKAHAQTFRVVCRVDEGLLTTTGSGSSRRRAEQAAAAAMLEKINTL